MDRVREREGMSRANAGLDNFHFAIAAGLMAPQVFDGTSLPLHLDTVNRQTERFIFYIDELDNVINLFDSSNILPTTPVRPSPWSHGSVAGESRNWGEDASPSECVTSQGLQLLVNVP